MKRPESRIANFGLPEVGNLFRATPSAGPGNAGPDEGNLEVTSVLARTEALRLEHLVSHGEASPPGFWYDQPEEEWVALLRGSATLAFADGPESPRSETRLELQAGDHLRIPAHRKHRVDRVSRDAVWIALHFVASAAPEDADPSSLSD